MAPRSTFLEGKERVTRRGSQRWRDAEKDQIYEWDPLHEEVEAYSKRGFHLGALDPETGEMIKEAEKGRRIDV